MTICDDGVKFIGSGAETGLEFVGDITGATFDLFFLEVAGSGCEMVGLVFVDIGTDAMDTARLVGVTFGVDNIGVGTITESSPQFTFDCCWVCFMFPSGRHIVREIIEFLVCSLPVPATGFPIVLPNIDKDEELVTVFNNFT